jgi:hypothetical protein
MPHESTSFRDRIAETARAIADREHLWLPQGGLMCWGCRREKASLPSLHCTDCLSKARERSSAERIAYARNGVWYSRPRKSPDEWRWQGMIDNMRHHPLMTRELGEKLLRNAAGSPGAAKWYETLRRAFDERFPAPRAKPNDHGGFADDPGQWEPPEPDCWEILDLSPASSKADVVRRFRELSLLHHPDRGGDTATMQRITAAYHDALRELERR